MTPEVKHPLHKPDDPSPGLRDPQNTQIAAQVFVIVHI